MRNYLFALGLLLLICAVVTRQHQYYPANALLNSQGSGGSIASATPNAQPTSDQSKKHQGNAPSWDFLFLVFGWPNGVGVCALFLTFIAIADQAVATRNSANAMRDSIAFERESLRPRLRISEFTRDTFREAIAGEWVFVYMKISNSGGLPAYGVVADTWIEFVRGEPPYKFSSLAKYARATSPLNVHTGNPSGFFIPLHRKLTEEERYAMGHAMGTICFRVRLMYRAFGDEVHTDEAYSVGLDGMESIGEYTSET